MKFCKTYEDYVQRQLQMELPVVEFKNLKKILKHCHGNDIESQSDHSDQTVSACPHQCPVCDGTFFPELVKEMSAIVGSFNKQAERLLEAHLATGFKRYYLWLWCKSNQGSLIQEGQELVTYAMINAVAMRKILKKYDKVHCSKQGQTFKSQIQRMHIEILQSPWLCELIAFHINLRERGSHDKKKPTTALFEGCNLTFVDGKPSLTCELFDSIKLDVDLTCSICLDTVFDPVALTCGHIFCHICACSAASVTIVDGLSEASPKEKCPLCREARVFRGFVHLEELKILLSRRCPEYWEQRLQDERTERIRQVKEHWEKQCRNFVGI